MHAESPLISTIVISLCLAFIFGAIAHKLKISPIVGYLLAGVLFGPHTPGFIADQELTPQLSEIGIILLMFGVGLHFSFKDLLDVRKIAIPGALVQMCASTLMGLFLGLILGWSVLTGLIFGLALSVASTVVLLRTVQEHRLMETQGGKIAIGWLVVEDLATVLVLVLLPSLAHTTLSASSMNVPATLLLTTTKVILFVIIMMVFGRRIIPWILKITAQTGSKELFRLAVLAIALGVAFGAAKLFDVSLPLGAFFAGMIMSETELSQRAAEETMPLRDAFAVLFFVSVGMLFNFNTITTHFFPLLATLLIIIVGKSLAAFLIMRFYKYPLKSSLTIAASLAQIGEFSFILAGLGFSFGLLPAMGRDLILAGAILSILLNPLIFWCANQWVQQTEKNLETPPDSINPHPDEIVELEQNHIYSMNNHVIIIGYGRIGSIIGQALKNANIPLLVIDERSKIIDELSEQQITFIAANALLPDILIGANIEQAQQLIITTANPLEVSRIIERAHDMNKDLDIIAYAENTSDAEMFEQNGANTVIYADFEIANIILQYTSLSKNDIVTV